MDTLAQDLRYAVRTLLKRPGFAAVAMLTLALGIGANTAIFSVVHAVLLRPLPYPEPDELVQVRQVDEAGTPQLNVSYPNYADLRDASRSFEAMGAYGSYTATVSAGTEAVRVDAATVTAGFFEALGVAPARGRGFLPDELGETSAPVVVVGDGFWRTHLGGERDLSDAAVRIGDDTYRVIGVMPPGFNFPVGAELWLPSSATMATQNRTAHNFRVIGRRSDDVTTAQARADLSGIARRLAVEHGDETWMKDATVVPLHDVLVGSTRPALLVLIGAAGFLLLIACANVVNLLLARMAARQRELAIRLALGATHRRLAAQVVTETLVLGLAGGALGLLLAVWGVSALLALEPGLPRLDGVGINWTVLLFALGVSVLAALAVALVPAARVAGGDIRAALSDGQRTTTGGVSSHVVRRVLAVSQVALTLVLLVGAGLLARSFLNLLAVDPGYRTEEAVVMDLWLPYAEGALARTGLFHEELLERVRALPGVEEAGGVSAFPLTGGGANGTFWTLDSPDQLGGVRTFEEAMRVPGLPERIQQIMQDPARAGYAEYRLASAGYFRAMDIPLLRGRLFDEGDGPEAPHVAVISESLAESRWPGEDPIGRFVEYGNMDGDLRPFTIVGVVGDIRERGLDAEPRATFYGNARQRPRFTFTYHVAIAVPGDPGAIITAARAIVHELNPDAAMRFRTLEQVFAGSLADRRFTFLLLGVFGATALLLAVIGVYGVIAYLASLRTREIGIRLALGAPASSVLRMLLGQGAALALIGVAIGLAGALALTRLLGDLLYDVGTLDPVTFLAVATLLAAVGILASYIPARRAQRIDPMATLSEP